MLQQQDILYYSYLEQHGNHNQLSNSIGVKRILETFVS